MSLPATPEALAERVETVYTLPATFHRISEAVNNPDYSIDDIAEVISNDQSIALSVLQLANSAFFAFPSKVETISQALTLIGIRQVRDLIQGVAVIEMFDGLPVGHVSMRGFWEHSIACGLAAKVVAGLRQEPNVERFFVLGLLHDVGRLILFQHEPEAMRQMIDQQTSGTPKLLHQAESEMWGYSHADVSAALMQGWHFPKRLCEGVKHHHVVSRSGPYVLENATVHFADILAHTLAVGGSGERLIPPPQPEAWRRLSLEISMLDPLMKELDRQLSGVLAIMLGQ